MLVLPTGCRDLKPNALSGLAGRLIRSALSLRDPVVGTGGIWFLVLAQPDRARFEEKLGVEWTGGKLFYDDLVPLVTACNFFGLCSIDSYITLLLDYNSYSLSLLQ